MKKINFVCNLIKEDKIKLINPNDEICESYINKSLNSLNAAKLLFEQDLLEESISMSYYSMFHISLGLFFKIGMKCENHNAVIILLKELFEINNSDISFAKKERIDKQYYIDFNVTKEDSEILIDKTKKFRANIYNYINTLNNKRIKELNLKFKKVYFGDLNE